MRKTAPLALLAALAVVVGVAAWMLGGGGGESGGSTLQRRGAERDAPQLPQAEVAEAVPQDLQDAMPAPDAPAMSADAPLAAEEEGPPSFTFRGRIVDDTGLPIAGATAVYWPNEATTPSYAFEHTLWSTVAELAALPHAQTGVDGRFELKGRFVADKGGFRGDADPALVAIADGYAIRTHRCKLYGGGDYDAGDLALEPGGWFEGRIVDGRGQPIAGATIKPWNPRTKSVRGVASEDEDYFSLSGVLAATLSGEDGRFHTGGLWQGKAQLGVDAEGFLDLWLEYRDVTAGRATDLGDVVMDSGAMLAGYVRDTAGAAIGGARVVAVSSGEMAPRRQTRAPDEIVVNLVRAADDEAATTDATGRFEVPRLEAVNHSLLITAAGYDPLQIDDLLPGRADVGAVLQRAATLRLAVTSHADGRPLPEAKVQARRCSSLKASARSIELAVAADATPGSFLVEGLGRALTRVTVGAPGHATQTIELPAATPPEVVQREVALVPESVLAGRVLGDDGLPRPDAELVLRSKDRAVGEDPSPIHADEAGRFEFRGLAAGEWSVQVDAPDWSPVSRSETLGEGEHRRDIELILPRAAVVFGTCYRDDGTAEPGAYLAFTHVAEGAVGASQREGRSDAAGRYEQVDLPIGHWRVYGQGTQHEFDLAAGQRLQLDLTQKPATMLQGRVLRADGTPVAGAWVFLSSLIAEDTRIASLARTDASGHWLQANLNPGRLEIAAAVTGGGGSSERVSVELAEGEQRTIDLHLGDGRVTGRVVQASEVPLPGAIVRVVAVADDGEDIVYGNFGSGGDEYEFGVTTDADGRFELNHLGPARYGVSVDSPGMLADKQEPFELGAGQTIDLLIPVQRTGRIAGRITLASGVPVHDGLYLRAEGPGERRSCGVEGGLYELKGLVAGEWRLTITEQQRLIVDRAVTLAAGQELDLDLLAQP